MDHPKYATPEHEILPLIRARWSPRAFDASKAIAWNDLLRLFEAARWAPSSGNEQPWRFIVTTRERTPESHARLLSSLNEKNQAWASAAPVVVLVAVRLTHERNDAINAHAWYDTGQAVGFLTLQATSMGLSIRQMAGFDADRARDACAVPEPFEPAVLMVIGYAGDPDALAHDSHRQAERQPRQRRPLHDVVYEGRWRTTPAT